MIDHGGLVADKTHYLYPGMIFAHSEPYQVSTILGSCVAVVFIDPVHRVCGINHFIMPLWNGEGLPTPKFGNVAIQKLYEKVIAIGAEKRLIQAKVFGGASIHSRVTGPVNVGPRNVKVAFDMVMELGVPIVASDTGGNYGRKLILSTETGGVKVKMLKNAIAMEMENADEGPDNR
ncbi:MAG: chemotaxis protein CheD [Deltaproteobacteria bacterium]|nr:chemotaxis protein CheD [Deltaproteobacteria bacterium]